MGPIKKLVSDKAKELCSKEIELYCKNKNILLHKTAPYRHESNGRIERLNKTILSMIRKKKGRMDIRVENALRQYNDNYNRSLNDTPNNILQKFKENSLDKKIFESHLDKYQKEFKNNKIKEKLQLKEKVQIKNEK